MKALLKDTTYQGWKNRETWSIALYIENDPEIREIARISRSFNEFKTIARERNIIAIDCVRLEDPIISEFELNTHIFNFK